MKCHVLVTSDAPSSSQACRYLKYKKETSTKMYTPYKIGFNEQYGPYAHFGY